MEYKNFCYAVEILYLLAFNFLGHFFETGDCETVNFLRIHATMAKRLLKSASMDKVRLN